MKLQKIKLLRVYRSESWIDYNSKNFTFSYCNDFKNSAAKFYGVYLLITQGIHCGSKNIDFQKFSKILKNAL